jgi:hypothetical protein
MRWLKKDFKTERVIQIDILKVLFFSFRSNSVFGFPK